jgi:Tol biopolymer transport system component
VHSASSRTAALIALCVVVLAILLAATDATAQVELLTPDTPSPPTKYSPPFYRGASADGSTMFFTTGEAVTGEPIGPSGALFARANGATRLITRGADAPLEVPPIFAGSSADGSNVYFLFPHVINSFTYTQTLQRWNATGVENVSDESGGGFVCASPTGTDVVFLSYHALVPEDHDARGDLYVLSPSGLTLLTPGLSEADGARDIYPVGHSNDCSRIFFSTTEALASADGDPQFDVYDVRANDRQIRFDSTGPTTTNAPTNATFAGASADGEHVYFTTDEQLVAGDTDSASNLYERVGSATRRITRAGDAVFKAASADGSHVFFETAEQLVADDTDTQTDVYDVTAGDTRLVSTGTLRTDHAPAFFAGASADGSHALFTTIERVEPGDRDAYPDLYDRSGGTTTLISSGAATDEHPDRPTLDAVSPNGDRIVFSTAHPMTADDSDYSDDVYVSSNRSLRLLTVGAGGGEAGSDASFQGASADASRIFFSTADGLVSSDTDGQWDIYGVDVPTLSPPDPGTGPSDPGTGPPGTPPGKPPTKAALQVTLTIPRSAWAGELGRGVPITASATQTAATQLRLSLPAAPAKALGLHRRLIWFTHTTLGPRARRITIRLNASTARRLARVRSPVRAELDLRAATATSSARLLRHLRIRG